MTIKPNLKSLATHDPELVVLGNHDRCVAVTPRYQGRILCALDGELMHRLDESLLDAAPGGEFKNLGGNSLWPAPEGGDFAFNYPPGADTWYVQDAIADQPARIVESDANHAHIAKKISLVNRKSVSLNLDWERHVKACTESNWPTPEHADVRRVAYQCEDRFTPLQKCSPQNFLLAPWSLEQFPGGENTTAFAKVSDPENAINYDFYGMPDSPAVIHSDHFLLPLGGANNFQIGVRVASHPTLLGALDEKRGILILRRTQPLSGTYFNIADNDQPDGPWSAADIYSVFNGAEQGFFELETIAPMQVETDALAPSSLVSETLILRADLRHLTQYLLQNWGIKIPA